MKLIKLTGGLGNQMFIYAFCLNLRAKGQKAFLFIPRKQNSYGHQGYELEKLFAIELYDSRSMKFQFFFLNLHNQFLRLFPKKWRPYLYQLIGIYTIEVPENFIFYPNVFDFKHKNELFSGTWQSELYFESAFNEVRKSFIFNEKLVSDKTMEICSSIKSKNSVSIHIRRGDYLSPKYSSGFSGVCTNEYYMKAIRYIQDHIEHPFFYIFTDDKEWVNENFTIEDAVYVNVNFGKNSWQDMYLMSQCKHNIIANSSFSWWGAWLNSNQNKIVIAPKLWWKFFSKDDVVPKTWIRL